MFIIPLKRSNTLFLTQLPKKTFEILKVYLHENRNRYNSRFNDINLKESVLKINFYYIDYLLTY